jgi:hypothetical protein
MFYNDFFNAGADVSPREIDGFQSRRRPPLYLSGCSAALNMKHETG